MDILAHALWTNAVYYTKYRSEKVQRYWAIFFGIFPDLVSFSPVFLFYVLYRLTGSPAIGHARDWFLNNYSSQSYNYTHSFVTFAVAVLVALIIGKGKMWWPLWGWALHITIDIFTHKGFYETPFLYPITHYKFDHGISWGHPLFMAINYSVMALVYLFWFFVLRNKHANKA